MDLKVTDQLKHFKQGVENTSAAQPRYNDAQKAKLASAVEDFESLLTSMMLKSMNKTTSGMFGENSYGGDYFDSIFEMQMASYISKNQGLGVADLLYKKITGEEMTPELKNKITGRINAENRIEIKNKSEEMPALTPSNKSLNRLGQFNDYIDEASKTFGVDKNLIKSVILTESAGNEKAISPVKAKGLMQLMDSTAADLGVNNVWDPKDNIFGGTKYLADMLKKYDGDLKLALAGYNAGPGNVDKYNGIPPFEETNNYIERVTRYLNYFEG